MFEIDEKTAPLLKFYEDMGFKPEIIDSKKIFKSFKSVDEELVSLFDGVGLRDISDSGILELTGSDVLDFLNRITTNYLKDLTKESIVKTIFTSEKGRIIDVVTIMNFEDHQLLICSGAFEHKIRSWIEKYIIMDDVKVSNSNSKYALLEVLGPQSDSFMTLVCGNLVNEVEMNKFKAVRAEGVMFFLARLKDKAGHTKFWILSDPENAVKLVDYMVTNKGIFNFNLIGSDSFDRYRILQGIPSAPNELSDQYNPHEANLIELISFTKGCYIGQEVIARLDSYSKVQKYLKGISFHEPVEENGQLNLFDESNNDAGIITSIGYLPKSGRYIGLGYVRKPLHNGGTILTAKNGNGKSIKVTVENLPFKR